jgi:putative nucleotidyltransferase with HDIG domain
MVALADIRWIPGPPEWRVDWPAIDAACSWLATLAGTPQDPIHHAEGDVLTHTRMVAEALVHMEPWRALAPGERAALFLAALLHDIGKPATTEVAADGRITAPGHARIGAVKSRALLWGDDGIGAPLAFHARELVVALVRFHGLPLWFLERSDIARAVLPTSLRVPLSLVALLAEADVRGRVCVDGADLLERVLLFREWCAEQTCLEHPYPFPSAHSRVRYCRGLHADPSYHVFDDTWGEVVLLAGLPGAGKDTWLRAQQWELPLISLDALRAELRIEPEEAQDAIVNAAKARARELLRKRQPFVWNATNLTRRLRDSLAELFLGYGARIHAVYLDTPPELAIQRNRQRRTPVPETVIRRLAARAEPPDLTEAHRVTIVE